ncbi:MAG: hypothetical protein IPH95_03355 [Candidatus Promineofilum sp.]|nr:hypothetical protein [Promineifilum sp.]
MRAPGALRSVVLVLALCGLCLLAPATARSQDEPDLQAQAAALLQAMTVPERIGQLFLVTFRGDRASADSAIGDLILNYHVGGVALLSENDNLTGYGEPAQTPIQVRELTGNLQRLALLGFSEEPNPEVDGVAAPTAEPQPPAVPLPLLLATSHAGDSLPMDNVLAGYTAVPNNMALGATWEPAYAQRVGEIVGRELTATGINLLLGPSLDVLERPSPLSAGDLGTSVFGGDPYWTGQMGIAYVTGVHSGSVGRLAVAARSFPGKGSSDRSVDVEVPTVRRSLEQLKQIELAPFFAVTRQTPGAAETSDALLATHIRYQGFQGNIRATTAPVSLDPQALNSLMALPEFAPWRQGGGVIVSDRLGARSVQRFYDDTEREFPHRQVAKDALLAGNDLLFVADFALGAADEAAQLANVKDTITWFRERYETDPTFRQRVDEAVGRILQLKLRLYGGDFALANVIGETTDTLPFQHPGDAAFFDIAEAAITLLAPTSDELGARQPNPPTLGDQLVIFTDVQTVEPCSTCEAQPLLSPTALQERILALYGPTGSGQVQPDNISSFSFADLNEYLDAGAEPIPLPTTPVSPTLSAPATTAEAAGTPAPTATLPADYRVQEALREADWLVFALLNAGQNGRRRRLPGPQPLSGPAARPGQPERSGGAGLRRALLSRQHRDQQAERLLWHLQPDGAFVDAAARALFLESPLLGAPPVSIEGIQFDLFTQTQPTPDQIIELFLVIGEEIEAPSSQEPLASAIGDTLRLQTGIIVDRNGRAVPDGTLVRFILRNRVQGTVTILGDRPTTGGIAQLDYVLDASMGPGQFRITAESGEATVSQEVDIVIEEDAQLAIIIPTAAPTETATVAPTLTPTPEPTATPEPPPTAVTPPPPSTPEEPGWLIGLSEIRSLLGVLAGLLAVGFAAVMLDRLGQPTPAQRVRRLLWGLVGGLLLYNYYVLEMPGAGLLSGLGNTAGLVLVVLGGAGGLLLYRAMNPAAVGQ